MVNKIGNNKLLDKPNQKDICPLCLANLNESSHVDCLPKGKIVIKRGDYVLFTIKRREPVIKRMLSITNDENNNSKEFLVLYVNNCLVGYKTKDEVVLLPNFSNEMYGQILRDYLPKREKKKLIQNTWGITI